MVVLGTKPEYFNAVWVKNEWSRFLALVKDSNGKKTLIPAYKDMDPYDLPEEFSHLQAQDMSKLGFMQDLIRGIKKLTEAQEQKPAVVVKETVASGGGNPDALLRRAFMFLEDGDWTSADEYCEKVLDQDPENAQAYLGKLMAEKKVKTQDGLKDLPEPFDDSKNYQKAIRFGDKKLVDELKKYIAVIVERNKNEIYMQAISIMKKALQQIGMDAKELYEEAAKLFKQISGYKDADTLIGNCFEQRNEVIYVNATAIFNNVSSKKTVEAAVDLEKAASLFKSIKGYKDADILTRKCFVMLEEARKEANYLEAVDTMNKADTNSLSTKANLFQKAANLFKKLKGYKDSEILAEECLKKAEEIKMEQLTQKRENLYQSAKKLLDKANKKYRTVAASNYELAIQLFKSLTSSDFLFSGCNSVKKVLQECLNDYEKSETIFHQISGYKDADELAHKCIIGVEIAKKDLIYFDGVICLYSSDLKNAEKWFKQISGYKDSDKIVEVRRKELAFQEYATIVVLILLFIIFAGLEFCGLMLD